MSNALRNAAQMSAIVTCSNYDQSCSNAFGNPQDCGVHAAEFNAQTAVLSNVAQGLTGHFRKLAACRILKFSNPKSLVEVHLRKQRSHGEDIRQYMSNMKLHLVKSGDFGCLLKNFIEAAVQLHGSKNRA
jgi:hypothetical protein